MEIALSFTPDQWQRIFDGLECSHWQGHEFGTNTDTESEDRTLANIVRERLAVFNVEIKDQ